MLKVNLLPSSYRQRRLVRRTLLMFVVLLAVLVGGLMKYNAGLVAEAETLTTKKAALEKKSSDISAIEGQAASVRAEIQPIKDRVKFFDQMLAVPEKWCAIIDNAVKYTYSGVELRAMNISGTSLTMQGHTPNMRVAARYLLNALRNKYWTNVTINGPPGYPAATSPADMHPHFRPTDYDLQITVTMQDSVALPSFVAGSAAPAGGGMMGDPGMSGPPGGGMPPAPPPGGGAP